MASIANIFYFFRSRLFRYLIFAGVLVLLFLFCCRCQSAATLLLRGELLRANMVEDWSEKDGTFIKDIVYDKKKNLAYDLYLPKNYERKRQNYAMLFIHGGSWNSGDKEQMSFACKRFAKAGYVTATMNYSLAGKGRGQVNFFTMLKDIGNCLAHLKMSMEKRGVSIRKAALSGFSAGGHLAMLYAFTRKKASPIEIAFVFQQVGPTLFTPEAWGNKKEFALSLASAGAGKRITAEDYAKGRNLEVIKSISPALLVNKDTVPGIYAYGGRDTLVAPIHGQKLEEALKKNKVPHQVIIFPNSGHILSQDPKMLFRFHMWVLEYCKKYFR